LQGLFYYIYVVKKIIPILILIVFSCNFFGQNIDSLNTELKNAKHDTAKALIYLKLSEVCPVNEIIAFSNSAITICNKNLKNDLQKQSNIYLSYKARALGNIGFFYSENEKFETALKYYDSSRVIQEKIKDKTSLAVTFNNIGYVYELQGLVEKALEYYFKSLKLHEELNNKQELTSCYNNIGSLFDELGDPAAALEYYKKSLALKEIIKDKKGIATVLNNIGLVYYNQNDLEKAMDYYNRSLVINEEIKNTSGISILLDNIGGIYQIKGDLTQALFYFNKSLALQEIDKNYDGQIVSHTSIGEVYFAKKEYNKAKEHTLIALKYSLEYGYVDQIRLSANRLYAIYMKQNQFEKAIEMRNLEIQMRDSVINEKTKKASLKSQIRYEYEKKAIEDSLLVVEERKLTTLQLKQEKTQRFALYIGLGLSLIFIGFVFNRFKVTQKQKNIIELKEQETKKQNIIITQQKELVEEKQKEISDSINYAKRIQTSFLANDIEFKKHFNDFFILFKPKDVVSGDFYWATSNENKLFVCVADSTGHGIPGAFMSLLNISLLNEAVLSRNYTSTIHILNFVRRVLILGLKPDETGQGGNDGMDCTLFTFDLKTLQMEFSGANNPLWIVRDGKIIELKADKMPVGRSPKELETFSSCLFQLQKNDLIYAFTDGYADQFGGPKGKKFKYKQLEELILSNSEKLTSQQLHVLDTTFKNWQGNLDQVDDVCVVGIRV
jgi:serine phosphatase RsbU (regulator of sigma subunit)/Tfp pilus assembly protein PilF